MTTNTKSLLSDIEDQWQVAQRLIEQHGDTLERLPLGGEVQFKGNNLIAIQYHGLSEDGAARVLAIARDLLRAPSVRKTYGGTVWATVAVPGLTITVFNAPLAPKCELVKTMEMQPVYRVVCTDQEARNDD
jgi:hypothetical protein